MQTHFHNRTGFKPKLIFMGSTLKGMLADLRMMIWILALGFMHSAFVLPDKPLDTGTSQRPNIILILADDLGYGDVGVYGQKKIETPHIDALARDGMIFTRHYAGAPVCAPSRAVLLTGKHMGHSFIRGNDEWGSRGEVWDYQAMIRDSTLEGQRPFPPATVTVAKVLKEHGYRTGMIGKWGLGAPHTESIPTRMGFDYFFGYNCQRQAHTYYPVHLYENEHRYQLDNDTIAPHTGMKTGLDSLDPASYARFALNAYSETVSFDKLMGFVHQNRDNPFFLYWASPIPHLPLQAPQNWVDYYVKKFGAEKPYVYREGMRGSYYPNRYPRATYAAMVSYLDENIGKLISYLKEEGLYENTLIIFTSDNGPSYTGGTDSAWFDSGGPFASNFGRGKGFLYEGGIRVPLITTWPGKIKPGSKSGHISAFWDVFPTLCDVGGAKKPTNLDGISMYDELTGKKQKKHPYLYWEFPEYDGQASLRMGKWKVMWKDIKLGNKEIEVYDLEADPGETINLVDDHRDLVETFFEIMKKEHDTPEIERFLIGPIEEICHTRR